MDRSRPALGVGPLVFIRGGYWQELSARDSLFGAQHCVGQGLAHAALDHTLAPQADVAAIVAECRLALQTLAEGAVGWGIADPATVLGRQTLRWLAST